MHTLFEDGIDKAIKGVTTLEEVFRMAKRVEE
jgi:type II secretory ATPase GspE/PulE/Tfp pilus assembly ATPase PilB-like protein